MKYVGPCYSYKYWMWLVQYTQSMWRCGVTTNYIQLKNNDQNKGVATYIDKRPKEMGNIVVFINT